MFELFIRCRLFSQSKRWGVCAGMSRGYRQDCALPRALQLPEAQKQKEVISTTAATVGWCG